MTQNGKYPKNWIKEIREDKGYTLRYLAELVGIHHQTLSNIELSKANLTHQMLIRLADALGVHPMEITEGRSDDMVTARDEKERKLIETYRQLNERDQQLFLSMGSTFASASDDNPTQQLFQPRCDDNEKDGTNKK